MEYSFALCLYGFDRPSTFRFPRGEEHLKNKYMIQRKHSTDLRVSYNYSYAIYPTVI